MNWRALAFAPYCILIPTLVAFAEIAIFIWRGWGRSAWFAFSTAGVQVSGGRWLLGRGEQNWPLFISNIVLTATVYSLVGMVFGAGEELGWRGYLQERLIQRFGLSKGIICLGLLWSFWHLPLLLAGYNYPDNACIRRAPTVSDPAGGGVIRLGVADITHQKLLARCAGTRRW